MFNNTVVRSYRVASFDEILTDDKVAVALLDAADAGTGYNELGGVGHKYAYRSINECIYYIYK